MPTKNTVASNRPHHVLRVPLILLFTLALSLVGISAATAKNYHVKSSGNDSNPGTESRPFKTIQRATGLLLPGDTVKVYGGFYKGFRHTAATGNHGTRQDRIVYQAVPGANVVINEHSTLGGTAVLVQDRNFITISGFQIINYPRRGVFIVRATGTTVMNCDIGPPDLGEDRFPVSTGDDPGCPETHIIHNKINFNTSDPMSQEHAIYLAGPDSDDAIIRGNIIRFHNIQLNANNSNHRGDDGEIERCIIENNIIYDSPYNALNLLHVKNSVIQNNLSFNNGALGGYAGYHLNGGAVAPAQPCEYNIIANNTLISKKLVGIYFNGSGANSNNWVFNNLIISEHNYSTIFDEAGGNFISETNREFAFDNSQINNILSALFENVRLSGDVIVVGSASGTGSGARLKRGAAWNGAKIHEGGEASFMSKPSPTYDLSVHPIKDFSESGSGHILPASRNRPDSVKVDIGAYEYQGGGVRQAPPSAPLGVSGRETAGGEVTLTWQPNPEPDVAGYIIHFGARSVERGEVTEYNRFVDVGNATTGVVYPYGWGDRYFAVQAYNTANSLSQYSSEVNVRMIGEDDVAPAVTIANPVHGAVDVPIEAKIYFLLSDERTGVDTSSVSVLINGDPPAATSFFGDSSQYAVVCVPDGYLPAGSDVTVDVTAADKAFMPNIMNAGWSFSTKGEHFDVTPPSLVSANPPDGKINVDVNSDISFVVSDYESGVDTNTVTVLINGVPPASRTFFGDQSGYAVLCKAGAPLPAGTSVSVEVTISDLAPVPNTLNTSWSFTTAGGSLDSSAPLLSGQGPRNGAVDVDWDTEVFFILSDAESGVDTNTVAVLINGVPPQTVSFHGVPSSYAVVCETGSSLPAGTSIGVDVSASDLAPQPNQMNASWSFTTADSVSSIPDLTAPTITSANPSDGASGVREDTDVIIVLSDAQSGVDTNSVTVLIDGSPPASTTFYGVPSSYAVVCDPGADLPGGSVIDVVVIAADNASNQASASWSFTTTSSAPAPDLEPPSVAGANPADGAVGVAQDASVFFALSDLQAGVDTNSVTILIDGAPPASVSFFGFPASYAVVCRPATLLPPASTVSVVVVASDLAIHPNQTTAIWTFTTAGSQHDSDDVSPPVFYSTTPKPNAPRVDMNSKVSVKVRDNDTIDPTSISFFYNGTSVPFSVAVTDTAFRDVRIDFDLASGLDPGNVDIRVEVCDPSENCATLEFSFTAVAPTQISQSPATIVPDGYWRDEPDRPLEIRDIPLLWKVRIFDTAGLQVKSFENTREDGIDWIWDFTNNSGRRVAKSLYLVRVIDELGVVRKAGRFVVQSE